MEALQAPLRQRRIVLLENPFESPGNRYRANLHAHTTASDGDLSPEEAADFYRRSGYQVLSITDHSHVTEVGAEFSDFLLISGVELQGGRSRQDTPYHIVGLDVRSRGRVEVAAGATAQDAVDMLRDDGGETILAHPYWSGLMAEDVVGLHGCFALEVYNTGCDLEILRGYSMVHWDDLLTLGHDYGAVAVDDGHAGAVDHGLGWTMVRAQELSVEAVMDSLRRGLYYSSTGPEIVDLRVTERRLTVRTSPVKSIALVSGPHVGGRRIAEAGETIAEAQFALPPARYCRLEAADADGKTAWSNPIILQSASDE
jgi:hypothetical protein